MDCCTNLKSLVKNITDCQITGSLDVEITGLTHDSRNCSHGYIFFAIHGIHYDGHAYINSAIANGALVIIYSESLSQYLEGVTYIQTGSVYESISKISSAYYNNPSKAIKVIGITGTDGKTSTCDYIYQLLTLANRDTSLLSSVWQDNGTGKVRNLMHITTPDAIEVHKFLHDSVNNGCEFAVVEASSHGLSNDLQRLADVYFTLGICTNITSDHLDFHKTRSSYIEAKMNLFRQLSKKSGIAIIPHEADWVNNVHTIIKDRSKIHTWRILEEGSVLPNDASYILSISKIEKTGVSIIVHSGNTKYKIKTPFLFPVQISNFAPALITLFLLSDKSSLLHDKVFEKIEPIPGRFNILEREGAATIMVDFAHTGHAFHTIFNNVLGIYPKRNFLAVFGSAGCRDTSKREHLGRIASQYCTIIILTDEDPREEDSLNILHDIRSGIPANYPGTIILQPERRKAIKTALQFAKTDDIIFCLGKGHETSIEKKGVFYPWDEEKVILELIKTQGDD
ncbi:MAG: UDP-N-acetylmuramoyl-L-alanyl-D-glutamate--2,6-diaminopimelate ligase [Bacteroidetes bacterium]|nr:UDP-N-acetylmuramoyl-L-alanyl-D-glutamate--2,6-diaminopimelate ligase [Bacteroidota bacterium]